MSGGKSPVPNERQHGRRITHRCGMRLRRHVDARATALCDHGFIIVAMRECSYEVYLAIYQAVRQGLSLGDEGIIGRISMHLGGRDSVTSLVTMLAMIDAKRGDPERSRGRLCGDVRCDGKCPAWRSGGGGCGS